MAAQAVIRLSRTSQLSAALRSFSVTLDGNGIGTISASGRIDIPVHPGSHTIQCSMYFAHSASIEVNVDPEQTQSIECGVNQGRFQLLLYLRTAPPFDAALQKHDPSAQPWLRAALIQSTIILVAAIALVFWRLYGLPALQPNARVLNDRIAFLVGAVTGSCIVLCFAWNYLKANFRD